MRNGTPMCQVIFATRTVRHQVGSSSSGLSFREMSGLIAGPQYVTYFVEF